MKKILVIILALALILALAVPALAEDAAGTITGTDTGKEGTTSLTYTVAPSYTIIIPPTITLTADDRVLTGSGTFSVTAGSLIDANKSLKFAITASNGYSADKFHLVNGSLDSVKLPYTIKEGTTPVTQGADAFFLTATAAEAFTGVSKTLTVTSEAYTQAGEYTDTLTITVSLV